MTAASSSQTRSSASSDDSFGDRASLGLYVHFPWCVKKCPYCDFNSHELSAGAVQEDYFAAYVDALLEDLDREVARTGPLHFDTVFFGGGTPSLMPGAAVSALLDGIRATGQLDQDAEVTLEANPGAADAGRFAAYRKAGVNRLSIGVQSFDDDTLQRIGRIHDAAAAQQAITAASRAGFDRINVDLMYGQPGQSAALALRDVQLALDTGIEHLSWYQLTIEPNTRFHTAPPTLPDESCLDDMEHGVVAKLTAAGFERYEVSAWSKPGQACRHNVNYWQFGNYLGVGAGAHGKVLDPVADAAGGYVRYQKSRVPRDYLMDVGRRGVRAVGTDEVVNEYLMNVLRLANGVDLASFEKVTGRPLSVLEPMRSELIDNGYLRADRLATTARGFRWLDSVLAAFLR